LWPRGEGKTVTYVDGAGTRPCSQRGGGHHEEEVQRGRRSNKYGRVLGKGRGKATVKKSSESKVYKEKKREGALREVVGANDGLWGWKKD